MPVFLGKTDLSPLFYMGFDLQISFIFKADEKPPVCEKIFRELRVSQADFEGVFKTPNR